MSEVCEYVRDKMDRNYSDCFDKVKKEINSWRHRFLTVFGKITVIKTMFIPKFTLIATVIPNLSLGQIKEIEREFELFINDNNPSVTGGGIRNVKNRPLLESYKDLLAQEIIIFQIDLGQTS